MEDKRDCRICGNVSDGTHFGVDSCRACAAFFRRSVVMKKQYVCRQGGEKCFIKKNVRLMCRLCRYKKCLESGMLPDVVKNKLDEDLDEFDLGVKCEPSTSDAEIKRGPPSISGEVDGETNTPILNKVIENYRQLCSVRRAAEQAMWRHTYSNQMFAFTTIDTEIHPANFNLVSKIMRANVPATAEFINETFDAFGLLGQKDKWLVFQSFVPIFWLLENAWGTYKRFYNDREIIRFMLTQTTFSEVQIPEAFFSDLAAVQPLDLKEVSKLLVKCADRNIYLAKRINRANPSEKEFAAAIALLLWNPNLCDDCDEVQNLAANQRAKILAELHKYYKYEVCLEDYAGRLGEILCLFSTLQYIGTTQHEDVEVFEIFEVFSSDSFLYDLVQDGHRSHPLHPSNPSNPSSSSSKNPNHQL